MQNQPSKPQSPIPAYPSPTGKKIIVMMMGSVIGLNLLTACQPRTPNATAASQPPAATAAKPQEKPPASVTPDQPTGESAPQPPSRTVSTNNASDQADRRGQSTAPQPDATIIGSSGEKNIHAGPGDAQVLHIAYPGDRVKVTQTSRDVHRFVWYKIYFPKTGAEGWIAGGSIEMDRGRFAPEDPDPTPAKPIMSEDTSQDNHRTDHRNSSDARTATISGSGPVNIRSGPGTNYNSPHVAYGGDRVIVLASDTDSQGASWHRVQFPKSGADGWVAGHLLEIHRTMH